ncbi:TetR family transcriptional regulator [Streptomyces sp. CB01881]|uniref:TetR family transcriptional regulator n=1 Tax=Streptomyces sp. CB01881 TaxID=2078691 RepID=UPI000CDC5DD1|nr:TetR family transcriptional regulator [Streptomyces sp. CB01881]AUY51900.1 TetR family transcriptional regulator [Streptomyces sp. CB01881]TYC71328.1 TetR family transcriptional regulator [Streptomyces sp. CB01881]
MAAQPQPAAPAPAAGRPAGRDGTADGTGPGLRERKKQQTRDALIEAAHRLFLSQGFTRTTVDEIAAAVDVSQRTFFRYFANKDEVALAVLADAEDYFIEQLRRRPAEENPIQALRAAIVESWRELGSPLHTGPGSVTSALELIAMIEESPTLLAAHLCRVTEQERVVAQVIAAREGLDPAEDLRPTVIAAVFGSVLRAAHLSWTADQEESGPDGMIALIGRYFDQLGPALAGDWRR